MVGIVQAVEAVQEVAAEFTPVPPEFEHVASVADLKARLEWGEPALTIVDVRDLTHFNQERITGAISLPIAVLTERATQALEKSRDLYVYGETDQATQGAAVQLKTAGFSCVAALEGGLTAWKQVNGPVEGYAS